MQTQVVPKVAKGRYGLETNQGYPTAAHLADLAKYGASQFHRRSFAPVAAALEAKKEQAEKKNAVAAAAVKPKPKPKAKAKKSASKKGAK